MTRYLSLLFAAVLAISCGKEKNEDPGSENTELTFRTKTFEKRSSAPCNRDTCTYVSIRVPQASGIPVVADSINKKVFNSVRNIVYFGEKPYDASGYDEVISSFIGSYEELVKKFPDDAIPWAAIIKGTVGYKSENVLNIRINNYTFTGGAHGYEGDLSLLFDPQTGRSLRYSDLFTDQKGFTAFAEKKFREKYGIPAGKPINSTGLMFEKEQFALPQNIFFKEDGLLLLYNPYEVASYAEQEKEVLLPYAEIGKYLKVK